MNTRNRRTFILHAAGLCAALATGGRAFAAPALVDESDTTAKSLGYRANAGSVDAAKFPKYAKGQRCANCRFYTGAAGEAAGPCPMFPGKAVAADGWCNVYAQRA
ncbi:high-potential iron-sulfur protein [Paraburkholderia unamae]|uniref:High-potential iron-sulfur protein n=1 Tax=Paraburkholderia unamae TaxID=219649 RepID=A0ABX5K847_9BURK|nr:high-potential iron-sulfur protein [Paraburkholderia unamae]PVX70709.1 high potential iron-sulfur protein [Paraburkholderia unamae]RAR50749.1 high potential iron-sulfur protein [Paraburkholderia unamae]